MKRKALLTITGCTPKAFETLSAREINPVAIRGDRWSDYTLADAWALQAFLDASTGTDHGSASVLASRGLSALHPIDPFAYTADEEMWVALIRYDWPAAPEGWDCRAVVAGRWVDLLDQARSFVRGLDGTAKVCIVMALSATDIARRVFQEARDLGLPEGEAVHSVPEDLTGYPEWFKEGEMKRRALLRNWGQQEG